MTYMPGVPVEAVADAPQGVRDRVARLLMGLVMRELWDFRLMQTDPNFANYAYDRKDGPHRPLGLRRGARAGAGAGPTATATSCARGCPATGTGCTRRRCAWAWRGEGMASGHQALMAELFDMAMEPMRHEGPYGLRRGRTWRSGCATGAWR